MPDENGTPTQGEEIIRANFAAVLIEFIRAVRDVLNDWRVATALLVVILLLAGKVAGGDLMQGVEGWIHAWRCTP